MAHTPYRFRRAASEPCAPAAAPQPDATQPSAPSKPVRKPATKTITRATRR